MEIYYSVLIFVIFATSIFYYKWTLLFLLVVQLKKWVKPRKDVRGNIVLVTGGGGVLGRKIALNFASLGAVVVVWDINKKELDETVKLVQNIGGKAKGYVVNLCDRNNIYKAAEKVRSEIGNVDILINNAGYSVNRLLLFTPDVDIKRSMDVNVIAHFWTAKAFLPKMIERNSGHIVNISSLAGYWGVAGLTSYCSSKFACIQFQNALEYELLSSGIEGIVFTNISPYFLNSGMFEKIKPLPYRPHLDVDDTAAKITNSILLDKHSVHIETPKFIIMYKWILPWDLVCSILKLLTPDTKNPDYPNESYKSMIKSIHAPANLFGKLLLRLMGHYE